MATTTRYEDNAHNIIGEAHASTTYGIKRNKYNSKTKIFHTDGV